MEIKNEKKLIRLSTNLEELVKGSSPQVIYDNLVVLMKSQQDYFDSFNEDLLLSLVFFIYSYKKTKEFDLARKMISNLFFVKLLSTEKEKHQTECPVCYGDGDFDCNYCDGSGQQNCNGCDGTGEQECTNCDGSGEIEGDDEEFYPCPDCQGKGEYTCSDCQGDGTESCDECYGSGRESCQECGGGGEVDSEEDMYEILSVCSWNKNVFSKCESKFNTTEPAFSYSEFGNSKNNLIVLHKSEEHDELIDEVDADDYYCFYLEKDIDIENDLDKSRSMKIMILGEPHFYIQ